MQVTDVKIRKINQEGRMKAVMSVTFDHAFVVHDVKVVESNSGLIVAMPSKRTSDGIFRDVAHPISQESRNLLHDAVMRAYMEAVYQEGGRLRTDAMLHCSEDAIKQIWVKTLVKHDDTVSTKNPPDGRPSDKGNEKITD
jgi:stage V sporulation protein G